MDFQGVGDEIRAVQQEGATQLERMEQGDVNADEVDLVVPVEVIPPQG